MRRTICVLVFTLATALSALAQDEDNSLKDVPIKERIITGGGFGFGLTNSQDFISISPVVGYAITRKFVAGTGVTLRYTNFKLSNPRLELFDYAINPFLRYTVYRNIFLQTEFEYLNYEAPYLKPTSSSIETTREVYNSFMAGGGILQPIGDRAALYVMVLYNFSYRNTTTTSYSPYDSPLVIRAGINLGGFGF